MISAPEQLTSNVEDEIRELSESSFILESASVENNTFSSPYLPHDSDENDVTKDPRWFIKPPADTHAKSLKTGEQLAYALAAVREEATPYPRNTFCGLDLEVEVERTDRLLCASKEIDEDVLIRTTQVPTVSHHSIFKYHVLFSTSEVA